jgi:ATP-dependent exoDNAse (exonuclease V) beta subunit
MSDKDTQAKGKFEPPPWEREAFDALAARRTEEQAAQDLLAAVAAAAAAAEPEKPADPWQEVPLAKPDDVALIVTAADPTAPRTDPAAAATDEKAVEAMLLQLQAEESSDRSATKWVGWIASAVTFVLGASMLIFGLLAARDSGGKFANVVGSGVLSVFGLCFMGMALWVWISTSRSRGR